MKKRLLSILLAAAVAVSMIPTTTMTTEAKTYSESTIRMIEHAAYTDGTVTHYATLRSLDDTAYPDEQTLGAAQHFTSAKNAGTYLRKQMKARETSVCFTVDPKAFSGEQEGLLATLYRVAVAHTGDGTEGDYLRVQVANVDGRVWEDAGGGRYVFVFQLKWRTTAAEEAEIMDLIYEMEKQMTVGTDVDEIKLRSVYRYMMENLTYDYDSYDKIMQAKQGGTDPDADPIASQSFTAYGAVKRKTAVCQGLASLMYRVLLDRGIDNRIIINGDHAWNAVCLEGKWYMCDITFDLQNDPRNPKYCLLSREKMDKVTSHQWNAQNCFDYETINAYNWSAYGWDSWTDFILRGFQDVVKLAKGNEDGEQTKLKIYDTDGNLLKAGTDYAIAYTRNGNGYQTIITGKGNYEGQELSKDYQKKLGTVKVKKITRTLESKPNPMYGKGWRSYQVVTKIYFTPVAGAESYRIEGNYVNSGVKKTKSGDLCVTTYRYSGTTNKTKKKDVLKALHKPYVRANGKKYDDDGYSDIMSSLSVKITACTSDINISNTTSKLYTIKAGKTVAKF